MDIKLFFFILASIFGLGFSIPYFVDIFKKRTQPHLYTWLIWAITQYTAAFASLAGGGGWGAGGMFMAATVNTLVFLLALKYGTKNITKSDTIILIGALAAIVVWWQLDQPLIAVIMVTVIDFVGYFPTYRKSWQEPWSETVKSWIGFFIAMCFALLSLQAYNALTLPYVLMVIVSNLTVAVICLIRRQKIPKPISTR
ncbi:MAG: hypothetical protein A3I07_04515 [Candidatus Doudnabacteria bacterium RIFCSPLOWO2_02_FULL_42_9]|uniref:PQ-loop repeat-containing protein n=1 Tax=Candidatus Doudnabacteria bacterium RIFCSPHIGHO2_01_FULL_41_86 TaxID=1817821 RepID=A0A1F5N9P2_9BACT|nr:MAG: hypothetical protein A2717_01975 [Candidatus Doudnabacteria bacterium RIFCSPHIGHO2_01_FULL_41_86]OGE75082.1 MAG: hypothetical protein A3K07_03835 [Candidatus Doudnabacteria bacterium RIFCSPHIGHO2_01_43_10]OGE85332.1 MAG: hypothetical protein A3E28_01545 [Candidatus Doudnabacteria bacterium RIFCSPHIGHO2_12_FULL_42_22]OGE86870.1 MAG: hypothetical protein A3C49_02380 [Candidatus Doudnabacteria bacterium RIFCSPHIGHO2_02_FULL_42_25]OGE92469.1 MAG: hypothetical protein A2895_02535 [Candidatus